MRAQEFQPKKLVIFDIDDTLVHTQTKVNVVKDGQVTKELNSHDFTHYKLQPGEQFDFENFRNAHDFFHNSKPIIPMMDQLKNDIATGNKVVMVTARADFDDRELFLDTFRKYGVDIDRVHVYRAGNMTGKIQTEEKKKIIIRKLLDQGQYTKAIMYDDAVPNLKSFIELKKEYPKTRFYAWHVSLEGEASEYHRTNESLSEDQNDHEIHNYSKLDKILSKLCDMVVQGKQDRPEYYGMVAAAVVDPSNRIVARINRPGQDGKRIHAEHAAMLDYTNKYGPIPKGSIVVTTLSPCNEHMDERDGPSCTSIINNSSIKKVYCGYMDPTQDDDSRQFNLMETADQELRTRCKQFADTFLDHVHENLEERRKKQRKLRRAAYGPGPFGGYGYAAGYSGDGGAGDGGIGEDQHPNEKPYGPETKPTMPKGTVRVDVSDVYDWYKLGKDISNLKLAKPSNYGKGPPSTIMAFGSEEEEHEYINALKKLGLTTTDVDPLDPTQPKSIPRQKTDPTYNVGENLANMKNPGMGEYPALTPPMENFADGRNPQDKGDSKRHGVPTKSSVSSLRKFAKNHSGRAAQLAHWMANMKAGKKK